MNSKILRLALPSIASNIIVPLLGLVDVTIMGHIGGATSIAAIAVGSMIFNVMYWLFGFLRMGTSGLTAQAVGRGGGEERDILRSSLLMGLTSGLAIVMLQVPLQWLSFWLMQVQDDVSQLCLHYYYICVWGAPAMLGLYSLMGWFIGMQDSRTPMTIAIGQNVLNIVLSLFLVIVLLRVGRHLHRHHSYTRHALVVPRGLSGLLRHLSAAGTGNGQPRPMAGSACISGTTWAHANGVIQRESHG